MHLAGQIGLVPGTMQLVEGGAEAEARLALRHAFRALEAVGTSAKEIVQVSGTGNPDLLRVDRSSVLFNGENFETSLKPL